MRRYHEKLVVIMSLTNHLLLAANIEDIIKAVAPIVFMVGWGIMQLMNAKPKPPVPRAKPVDGGLAGQPAQGGKPATLEETLRREVEEFMRRAQGKPAEPAKRPPGKQQPPRREGRPARPAAENPPRPRRLTDAPGGLTTSQTSQAPPTGAGVGQHVAAHLGRSTQELAAHARALGADVAQSDERLQSHLKQKFEHQVGALEHRSTAGPSQRARTPVAQSIFEMLKRPEGVKQAVILGEILRRPEDRRASSRSSHES